MQTVPVTALPNPPRPHQRTVVVASADRSFRRRLAETLTGLRWMVHEAGSGSEVWTESESTAPEAVIVDSWLPDLDLAEFLSDFRARFPQTDVVTTDGGAGKDSQRGPFRQELLYALRRSQDTDTAAWNVAIDLKESEPARHPARLAAGPSELPEAQHQPVVLDSQNSALKSFSSLANMAPSLVPDARPVERLPELIGNGPAMLEVSRRVRLVAQRMTPVLIEGPTGSGKEIVAEALHHLSSRNRKPFVAINCAAIPEPLLEAELFGHTRGAFTGAVHGRVGRIEAADGGTLFLDEIGEMPLALQSKLLRFVECGELQRVGDNETAKVDVRILAATHRPLAEHARKGTFRSDLYYRLAVFLIRTPALSAHAQDLPLLVDHFLARLGREEPVKRLDTGAREKLAAHDWPGNVRELEHVLERAAILAGDNALITAREIDFGADVN